MSTRGARTSTGRHVSEDGPILLWRRCEGEGARGLLLLVGVCPFPGCPERHVLVDGFLVAGVPGATGGGLGNELPKPEAPGWAFTVSVEVDGEEAPSLEEVANPEALEWFRLALDADLRAQLRKRFERGRAELDAALLEGGGSDRQQDPGTMQGGAWSAVSIPADRLDAVIAGFRRGLGIARSREAARRDARVGRNDPCPCGSGRKYKRCCLGSA